MKDVAFSDFKDGTAEHNDSKRGAEAVKRQEDATWHGRRRRQRQWTACAACHRWIVNIKIVRQPYGVCGQKFDRGGRAPIEHRAELAGGARHRSMDDLTRNARTPGSIAVNALNKNEEGCAGETVVMTKREQKAAGLCGS